MNSKLLTFLTFFKSFERLCWIAGMIFLLIMLKHCGNSSDTLRTAALQKEDSIQAQKKQIIQLRNDSIRIVNHLIDSARLIHLKYDEQGLQWFSDAQNWKSRNQELVTYIASIKPQPADTMGYVMVPAAYPDSCSACANSLKTAFKGIDSLKDLADKTNELVTYELLIREKAAVIQERYSDSLQSLFNAQSQVVTALAKAGKPKSQIYAGVEILGGPVTVFQNIGGVLSLKTKQDRLFQISGGLTNLGTWYARINANFKIHF